MVIQCSVPDILELKLNQGSLEHTIQLKNAHSNSYVTMLTAL